MRGILAQLNLSDAQKEQLREVMRSTREERRALRGLEGEARRSSAQALRAQTRSRIDAILTPAQRAEAVRLHAARRSTRVDNRVARMAERLNLTAAQSAQVREILTRNSNRPGERRDRAARRAMRSEINNVLTTEQRELRRATRGERGERGNRGRRGGRGRGGGMGRGR